jgi:hypothetical protein
MKVKRRTMTLHRRFAPILTLLAGGCTDRATFVTSTDIGINANVTTEQVHIGYGRTELFQGPSYPDAGSVPEVVGYLGSNLEIFSPKIRQVYATGQAANLITQPQVPKQTAEEPDVLKGPRRPLLFGTESNIGLKLGFTNAAPSSIKFGYDRQEVSIIPLRADPSDAAVNSDGSKRNDIYPSVLGTINMDLTTPTLAVGSSQPAAGFGSTGLALTQFFATGSAARNLAKLPAIRDSLQLTAQQQVAESVNEAWTKARDAQTDQVRAYFSKCSFSPSARNQLVEKMPPMLVTTSARTALTGAPNVDAFVASLVLYTLQGPAADAATGLACPSNP